MRSINRLKYPVVFLLPVLVVTLSCSSDSTTSSGTTAVAGPPVTFAAKTYAVVGSYTSNVVPIAVNGGGSVAVNAVGNFYPNEPTVSVTICSPTDSTKCQTISNILVDTGSFGLRIFSSLITVALVPIVNGTSTLAECVQFGDGSSEWGPVQYAYVGLGGEPMVAAPILTINSTYQTPPAACSASQSYPDTNPAAVGFNGIIGVGLLSQDCGSSCTTDSKNGQYFSCSGGNCLSAGLPALGAQVVNPVALLPTDNNGVVMDFSSVSIGSGGAANATASMYLGIGTRANNASTGQNMLGANSYLQFNTLYSTYSATKIPGFIDSGSSIYFIPATTAVPKCSKTTNCSGTSVNLSSFLCPTSTQSLTATNYSVSGNGLSTAVSFSVASATADVCPSVTNMVFSDLAGDAGSSPVMDWGLPFFFGKKVFVGINGTTSTIGTGPYWAY